MPFATRLSAASGAVLAALWVAAGALIAAAPAQATEGCRLALVLALDISHSVDPEEQELQTLGVAGALTSPEVMDAILNQGGAVAAAAFRWSDLHTQLPVASWTLLRSEAEIEAFAAKISGTLPEKYGRATALGKAMSYAAWLHRTNPYDCETMVVDVSGDGVNNAGATPSYYRSLGYFDQLTINGLVIRNDEPDPLPYYRQQVVSGPGAFLIDVRDYSDYQGAMRRKLLRELAPMISQREAEETRDDG